MGAWVDLTRTSGGHPAVGDQRCKVFLEKEEKIAGLGLKGI